MAKILVTGGAGFIGSHVVDCYLAFGHKVVVLDDLSTGRSEQVNPKAKLYKLDLGAPEVADLFALERPDLVSHHAAQMNLRRSVEDPIFDAQVNIVGSLRLLEHCRRAGVTRFIFASTGGAIYGEQEHFPADEEHPTRPMSPYGVAKLAVERYLDVYRNVYGLAAVSLRYANVYGPRQNAQGEAGIVAIFCDRLLKGEPPLIYGDGHQTRDFAYVDDVVRANLLALDLLFQPRSDGPWIFNIGTGVETSVNRLLEMLLQISGTSLCPHYGPPKAGEQRRSLLDPGRAARFLGWLPTVDLEEGLKRTYRWFHQNTTR